MPDGSRTIGVLTSGGDAPGMNAALRAVTRAAIHYGMEVYGIQRGYYGLVHEDFTRMTVNSVADIIQRGGTILRTSRVREFFDGDVRLKARASLERHGIEHLIVVGGNGSLAGARELARLGVRIIGIPASIDNDISGSDLAIGFDTAVNTVLEAINRIRDTATSHERIFIIEVMGRESGQIALTAGLAGGAESILIPELPYHVQDIVDRIQKGTARGKLHSIIVVAEGCCSGVSLGKEIERLSRQETRVTVLGHTQRGGIPTAVDRLLASRFGAGAVACIDRGVYNRMVALQNGTVVDIDLADAGTGKKEIDFGLYDLARILSI